MRDFSFADDLDDLRLLSADELELVSGGDIGGDGDDPGYGYEIAEAPPAQQPMVNLSQTTVWAAAGLGGGLGLSVGGPLGALVGGLAGNIAGQIISSPQAQSLMMNGWYGAYAPENSVLEVSPGAQWVGQ